MEDGRATWYTDERLALALEYAESAARCLRAAVERPDAAPGLVRAAGLRGERLAALASVMRETGSRRAPARGSYGEARRLPELAERCDALSLWMTREGLCGGLPALRRRHGGEGGR